MGYRSCLADPNLWLKEQTNKKGDLYYSYILSYVDDLLVMHHDPEKIMNRINGYLPLKPDSIGPPMMYLGGKLRKKEFPDGTKAWGLSPAKYVQQAIKNCEIYLSQNLSRKYELPKQAENPFRTECTPDDDVSALLEPQMASYYMQLT